MVSIYSANKLAQANKFSEAIIEYEKISFGHPLFRWAQFNIWLLKKNLQKK